MNLLSRLILILPICAAASRIQVDQVGVSTLTTISSGINVSTNIALLPNASLHHLGPATSVRSASSVTASGFFGDARMLSGVATLPSTQTISGAATFLSSFTVISNGQSITLSTTPSQAALFISSTGALHFTPELHNSSSTSLSSYSTSNQYCGPCVTGSTLTITTSGGRIELVFSGSIGNNDRVAAIAFLQDGNFVGNLTSDGVISKASWPAIRDPSVLARYLTPPISAGTHSFCISLCTNYSQAGTTAHLYNTDERANQFFVKEIK